MQLEVEATVGKNNSASMRVVADERTTDVEEGDREMLDDTDRENSLGTPLKETHLYQTHFSGTGRKKAYVFDGLGEYNTKDWDLTEGEGTEFCWYHVELPMGNQKLTLSAQYLIEILCPPLKLQDILMLVSNGPFFGQIDGALIFRVNSSGPASSKFTLRLAARVTEGSVITVSLGRVPRLGFSPTGQSLLTEIPSVESPYSGRGDEDGDRIVIREHVLEHLLMMNHSEEADTPVPKTMSNLVVHIIDAYMDHIQGIVTTLEVKLDTVELELDKGACGVLAVWARDITMWTLSFGSDAGGFAVKKQMLDDRRFPKMHLNLQRLLQAVAHGEQVFPRVKEKCATKSWFANEDIIALEETIRRLRRLKENVGFLNNRVTAIQASLDSWQSEQINRKLYYLSFLSLIFLPLSIITGVFGMNVGGVPWTGQEDPDIKDGFRNVLLLCAAMVLLLLVCFTFPLFVKMYHTWKRRMAFRRSTSLNRKSFLRRRIRPQQNGDYVRI
ncbi:hypothetical protein ACLOJK_003203 [Asimina triloba]